MLSPNRPATERGNAYLSPSMLTGKEVGERLIYPAWDCSHTGQGEFTTPKGSTSAAPSCWVQPIKGSLTRFPHIGKADYSK